jgi:hypothetical protein
VLTKIISTTRIIKLLGHGNPIPSIVTSAIIAIVSFFYIYTIGSFLNVSIYILQNRISYNTYFDFFIINRNIDHIIIVSGIILWAALSFKGKARTVIPVFYGGIILVTVTTGIVVILDIAALMAIPLAISCLVYNRFAFKKILTTSTRLYINYIGVIVIIMGIASIIMSLGVLFFIPLNPMLPIRNYVYDIFLFFSSFSPILMFLLISCLPVKILIEEFRTFMTRIKKIRIYSVPFSDYNTIKTTRAKIICLALFMLLSVALALVPHQPTINTDKQNVGVDTHYYADWVGALINSTSSQELVRQAFVIQNGGDRPITLLFVLVLNKVVPANLVHTIEYVPVILGPALIFAVYLLTRELTSNDVTSLLASFLTAVSFHTLVGIYAGFYSNWLALVIGYLSFVILFKFLKKSSALTLAIYAVSLVLLLFTHIYTWSIFAIVTTVFLVVMLKFNDYRKMNIILLLLVVFASIFIDIARLTMTGSSSAIVRDISIATAGGLGLEQFGLRLSNMTDLVQNWYGAQFSNFIILVLGFIWICISNFRKQVNIFLVVFLSVGFATLFFGSSAVLSRVLYDIPFEIPAAISLTYIGKQRNSRMLLLGTCIWLVSISIRAVLNFNFI